MTGGCVSDGFSSQWVPGSSPGGRTEHLVSALFRGQCAAPGPGRHTFATRNGPTTRSCGAAWHRPRRTFPSLQGTSPSSAIIGVHWRGVPACRDEQRLAALWVVDGLQLHHEAEEVGHDAGHPGHVLEQLVEESVVWVLGKVMRPPVV